jgi:hypothetical protein
MVQSPWSYGEARCKVVVAPQRLNIGNMQFVNRNKVDLPWQYPAAREIFLVILLLV